MCTVPCAIEINTVKSRPSLEIKKERLASQRGVWIYIMPFLQQLVGNNKHQQGQLCGPIFDLKWTNVDSR